MFLRCRSAQINACRRYSGPHNLRRSVISSTTPSNLVSSPFRQIHSASLCSAHAQTATSTHQKAGGAANQNAPSRTESLKPGESLHGFELMKVQHVDELSATAFMFRHLKTNAEVVYCKVHNIGKHNPKYYYYFLLCFPPDHLRQGSRRE